MPAPPGMNETMYEAMGLEGEQEGLAYSHDDPEAPISIVDNQGQEHQMDPNALAAEGMAFAAKHMHPNGSPFPSHSLVDREAGLEENKMTKAQLKEQRMNEEEGYPSSLDEANRMKALEGRMEGMESGISQILNALGGQSSPASPVSNAPTGTSPASLEGPQTPTPGAYATVSPLSPPTTGPPASSVPASKPRKLPLVTLSSGRKIAVPGGPSPANPMSLGPATDQNHPPTQIEEPDLNDPKWNDNPDDWDDPVSVIPKPEAPKRDPNLEKLASLVQEVNGFMQTNDIHRFRRRHISRNLHRHVGYNGWPKTLQTEFDNRFKGFLQDPQFVSSVCRKVLSMELGPAIGAKHVVSFLVATAGFTAFALSGIDG